MIHHVTYSNEKMTEAKDKCVVSALKFGCDKSEGLSLENIGFNFYEKHKNILDAERGAGYWLWKPYIISGKLRNMKEGDFLIYTDAGVDFVNDSRHLIRGMTQEVMLFANGWRHGDWCKMDVMVGMKSVRFRNRDQVQATCIVIHKSKKTVNFIQEWLNWCCMPGMIDDSESHIPNEKTFREHRHDQAVLTNLAYLYKIKLHRWCAQYRLNGDDKFNDNYPQIFNHHGLRNNGKRK